MNFKFISAPSEFKACVKLKGHGPDLAHQVIESGPFTALQSSLQLKLLSIVIYNINNIIIKMIFFYYYLLKELK